MAAAAHTKLCTMLGNNLARFPPARVLFTYNSNCNLGWHQPLINTIQIIHKVLPVIALLLIERYFIVSSYHKYKLWQELICTKGLLQRTAMFIDFLLITQRLLMSNVHESLHGHYSNALITERINHYY